MTKTLLILLFFIATLQAKMLISPIDAMHAMYGDDAVVSKKNILLNKTQAKQVQHAAQTKLDTKIYRIFRATKDDKVLGYGILINRKVRSKNAVTLYMIAKSTLLGIEIIAFNEPSEYIPTSQWQEQFKDIDTSKNLQLNRNIPTITGATLSARSITDGSRIAFALYNTLYKGK